MPSLESQVQNSKISISPIKQIPREKADEPQPSTSKAEQLERAKEPLLRAEMQELNVGIYEGRIKQFYKNWSELTKNTIILDRVSGLKLPLKSEPNQKKAPKILLKISELPIYKELLITLKEKGVIKKCKKVQDQFLSRYFLRQKPNGSYGSY